ncbi:MAG TPA: Crp/Fnr family transcriptional regulator, partial [Solirubrobacteraceae bacterium]|nr:Crp/Fnr family transcriptional regulator [Solirubrobacteraceae bacterium]
MTDAADSPFRDLGPGAVTRRYAAGAAMFHAGDPSDWVALVVRGQVKIVEQTADSREVLLAVRGPGQLIGELSAIDGEPRSASAVAIDDVEVQLVDAAGFHAHLEAHPAAAVALLRMLTLRLRDADRKRVEFSSHDVLGRVARRLVELSTEYGTPDASGVRITLPLTQDELASYTASSREAVAKALRTLRDRRIISTDRRSIVVTD